MTAFTTMSATKSHETHTDVHAHRRTGNLIIIIIIIIIKKYNSNERMRNIYHTLHKRDR
jgi:hypothetical protein